MWPLFRSLAILSLSFLIYKMRANSSSSPPSNLLIFGHWHCHSPHRQKLLYLLVPYIQLATKNSWFTLLILSLSFPAPDAWTSTIGFSCSRCLWQFRCCLFKENWSLLIVCHLPLAVSATDVTIFCSVTCSLHQELCHSHLCNLSLSSVPGNQ